MTTNSEPAELLDLTAGTPRVAVITGSYGAGHNVTGREIARVLADAGCDVHCSDIVDLMPWRMGPVLRSTYYTQLRLSPQSWGSTLRLLDSSRRVSNVCNRILAAASESVVRAVGDADLVITTHPFGAQALGYARSTGLLKAPAVTYFTDTSVHSMWVHPAIDLNLAIHEIAASEARAWGGRTAVVRPLVPRRPAGTGSLPEVIGSWALVTGGSLGMGQLERTARDILSLGTLTPVVLCGSDRRLRRRLSRLSGVVALGWRDDVPALMAASSCIVQNAGGVTSLEALESGTPVVTYRPLPGHGVANSINLETAGLIPWARTVDDLALLLAAARTTPRINRLPMDAPPLLDILAGRRVAVAA